MELVLTDGKVLEELSKTDKTLWEKIRDWFFDIIGQIRRSYESLNQASKTAQVLKETVESLDEIERLFTEGVREAGERTRTAGVETQTEGEKVYSFTPADFEKPITLHDIEVLRGIGRKSINDFTSEDIEKAQKWAYKYFKDLSVKSPFFRAWFGEWRVHQKDSVTVVPIPKTAEEKQRSMDGVICKDTVSKTSSGWKIRISGHGERNTRAHAGSEGKSIQGLTNIKGLIENAILLDTEVHEHHDNNAVNDYIAFDHKLYALGTQEDGRIALYKITVEEMWQSKSNTNDLRFHNLKYIEKVADDIGGPEGSYEKIQPVTAGMKSATEYSIADLYGFVKRFDEEFTPAHKVSELVLNEDGTPKVFYHGTNAEFTAFDARKSRVGAFGKGFYLSPSKANAGMYGSSRIIESYVTLQNPYIVRDSLGLNYETLQKMQADLGEGQRITDKNAMAVLKKHNYDGIVVVNNGRIQEIVSYDPKKIKSATDNIGTFDGTNPDIRYSIDEDSDTAYLAAVERGDMETAQKMVDEAAQKAGYINLFYHGAKKGGGFTVFRDWSYFTENKAYAERYTDREKPSSLYKTYVKMDKPFDTRKTKDRRLFAQIRDEYGLGEIQDTGLPDWTDGYDISDYIDENDLDYDGIILDEGGDLVDGVPISRGLSYVVRKSAQIKYADPVTYDNNGNVIHLSERFKEDNSDIRYSIDEDSDTTYLAAVERDSIGNTLSDEQVEFFKDSKVRDKKGNLLVVYHGTTAKFYTFKKGDIGFHFGTKGAARGRVGFGKNVTIKEVYLNITNPIEFDEDLGSWDADYRLARELYDKGILSKEETESVLLSDDKTYRRSTESANKKLASVLMAKGYDGISYQNTFETKKATTSYIVFNSNQAKEITNKTPTSNPDIRYSIDETPETPDVSENATDTNDGRTEEELTDRDMLLAMAERLVGNEKENEILTRYKEKHEAQLRREDEPDSIYDEVDEQRGILFTDPDAAKRSVAFTTNWLRQRTIGRIFCKKSKKYFRFWKIISQNLLTNPPPWCIMMPMKCMAVSERGMTAERRIELWQPRSKDPKPRWYLPRLTARKSRRR